MRNCYACSQFVLWLTRNVDTGKLLVIALLIFPVTAMAAQSQQSFFDASGRLIAVVDPAQGSAQYNYDATGNILSIVRQPVTTLVVVQFTPVNGPSGVIVTISGTGFGTKTNTIVSFNGVSATPTTVTATQITVAVPGTATTGPIKVTAPSGTVTTSAVFTIGTRAAPTVTSFSPASALSGAAVTIAGSSFDLVNSKLYVNNQLSTLTAVNGGALNAIVPMTSSGRITVETSAGIAVSAGDFIVPPPGFAVGAVAASARSALGQTASVSVGTSNSAGLILFDAAQGQRMSAIVSSSTLSDGTLCLYSTLNAQLGACASVLQGTFAQFPTLTASGTYSLGVLPAAGVTGAIAVELHDASDIVGTIVENGTFVATLTAPGQNARVTFVGTAGDRIGLALQLGGGLASQCGVAVIFNPDGTQLYNSTSCGGPSVSGELQLPASGGYTILYSSSSAATGTATFSLGKTVTSTIPAGGGSTTQTIAFSGQNARVTFAVVAGDRIGMVMQQGGGLAGLCGAGLILNPDGSIFYNTTVCGPLITGELQLPASGTYTLLYFAKSAGTGTVTFTESKTVASTIPTGGGSTTQTIAFSGQNARATFIGAAGDRIGMAMQQGGGLAGLCGAGLILNPNGSILFNTTVCGGPLLTGEVQLPTAGTYTLLYFAKSLGTGTVKFTESKTVSSTIPAGGGSTTQTIAFAGQNARATFVGAVGDHVGMAIQQNGGLAAQCGAGLILAPDGSILSNATSCTGQIISGDVQLPTAGIHTVLYFAKSTATGTVTMTESKTVSSTIPVGGGSTTQTIAFAGQNARATFTATAGDHIGMALQQAGGLAGQCAAAQIINPDGSFFSNMTSCSGTIISGGLQVAATGTYTLLYSAQSITTGTVTLTLSKTPGVTFPAGGGSTTQTIALPGQNALVTLVAAAGDRVGIAMQLGGSLATQCGAAVLFNPDGSQFFNTTGCAGPVISGDLQLAAAGTYTLLYSSSSIATGSVTLSLSKDAGASLPAGGGSTTQTIAFPGQNAFASFTGSPGDHFGLALQLGGGLASECGAAVLINPDGSQLFNTTRCPPPVISGDLQLPAAGAYALLFSSRTLVTGSATLSVSPTLSANATIGGASVPLTTTIPGQNIRVAFVGTAAQIANVAIATVGFGSQCYVLLVLNPDGSQLSNTTTCAGNFATGPLTLPTSGTYTVEYLPSGPVTGSVTTTVNPS